MTGLAHPLEDILGTVLVEASSPQLKRESEITLDSWFWTTAIVAAIGLLAFATR